MVIPYTKCPFPCIRCRTESADAPFRARRATESYSVSTARKRNAAGADAAAFECRRIHGTGHQAGPFLNRPVSGNVLLHRGG